MPATTTVCSERGRPRGGQRWSTFLRSHARGVIACDFRNGTSDGAVDAGIADSSAELCPAIGPSFDRRALQPIKQILKPALLPGSLGMFLNSGFQPRDFPAKPDSLHARTSEYSWCKPPSIALACTERKSSSRCATSTMAPTYPREGRERLAPILNEGARDCNVPPMIPASDADALQGAE